jgi:hypothetical protein
VVSDAVPEEVDPLHPIVNSLAHCSGITPIRVVRERICNRWHPERGQVRLRAQEPPEAEAQLGDDLAVDLGQPSTGRPIAGHLDVSDRSGTVVPAREQLATPVPDHRPTLGRAIGDECFVDGVAEHDLKSSDVLVESAADLRVPVVERERMLEVTTR